MTSHLAKYSGVSFGAFAGRPSRPSSTNTGLGGGTQLVARMAGTVLARGEDVDGLRVAGTTIGGEERLLNVDERLKLDVRTASRKPAHTAPDRRER